MKYHLILIVVAAITVFAFHPFDGSVRNACAQNTDAHYVGDVPENASPVERCVVRWEAAARELQQLDSIEIVSIRTSRRATNAISEAEFRKLFLVNAFGSRRRLDQTAKYLDNTLLAAQPGFTEIRFVRAGGGVRLDRVHVGKSWTEVQCAGVHVMFRPHNKQVILHSAGKGSFRMATASEQRLVPRLSEHWQSYACVEQADGDLCVTADGQAGSNQSFVCEYVIDRETERVIEKRVLRSFADDEYVTLELQSNQNVSDTKVFFPRLLAVAEFKNDQLTDFDIRLNFSVDTEPELEENVFAVPVPAGWIISDQRGSDEIRAVRMPRLVPDIIQWALAN